MTSNRSVGSFSLVIFGATGDLAKRKLFPALFSLYKREQLPEDFQVIGIGRSIRNVGDFHQAVKDSVHSFGRIKAENEEEWSRFIRHFQFVTSSVDDPAGYQQMKALIDEKEKAWQGAGNGNRLFYLAIAPDLYGTVSSHLKESGLTRTNGWKRIIIEKPIGHDYESAKQLNEQIKKPLPKRKFTGLTITWARKWCKTSKCCGLPILCLNRSGIINTLNPYKSRPVKRWALSSGPVITIKPVR